MTVIWTGLAAHRKAVFLLAHRHAFRLRGRAGLWNDALEVVRRFPLTGTGLNTLHLRDAVLSGRRRRRIPTRPTTITCNSPPKAGCWSAFRPLRSWRSLSARCVAVFVPASQSHELLASRRRRRRACRDGRSGIGRVQPAASRKRRDVCGAVRCSPCTSLTANENAHYFYQSLQLWLVSTHLSSVAAISQAPARRPETMRRLSNCIRCRRRLRRRSTGRAGGSRSSAKATSRENS